MTEEEIDRLVISSLVTTRELFLKDMMEGDTGVFHLNPVEDNREIIRHIDALDMIISWYNGK